MLKLRNWLDEKNIEWEDRSENFGIKEYEWWICRTHFYLQDRHISVINGCGTYGGFGFIRSPKNEGLLEVMGLFPEVEGYHTAEELILEMQKYIDLEEKK